MFFVFSLIRGKYQMIWTRIRFAAKWHHRAPVSKLTLMWSVEWFSGKIIASVRQPDRTLGKNVCHHLLNVNLSPELNAYFKEYNVEIIFVVENGYGSSEIRWISLISCLSCVFLFVVLCNCSGRVGQFRLCTRVTRLWGLICDGGRAARFTMIFGHFHTLCSMHEWIFIVWNGCPNRYWASGLFSSSVWRCVRTSVLPDRLDACHVQHARCFLWLFGFSQKSADHKDTRKYHFLDFHLIFLSARRHASNK